MEDRSTDDLHATLYDCSAAAPGDFFDRLSLHVPLRVIFSYLHPREAGTVSLVSRRCFHEVFCSDLWHRAFATSEAATNAVVRQIVGQLTNASGGLRFPFPSAAGGATAAGDTDYTEDNHRNRNADNEVNDATFSISTFSKFANAACDLRSKLDLLTPALQRLTLSAVSPLPRLTKRLRKVALAAKGRAALEELQLPAGAQGSRAQTTSSHLDLSRLLLARMEKEEARKNEGAPSSRRADVDVQCQRVDLLREQCRRINAWLQKHALTTVDGASAFTRRVEAAEDVLNKINRPQPHETKSTTVELEAVIKNATARVRARLGTTPSPSSIDHLDPRILKIAGALLGRESSERHEEQEDRDLLQREVRCALARLHYVLDVTKTLSLHFERVAAELPAWYDAAADLEAGGSPHPLQGVRVVSGEIFPPLKLFNASHAMAARAHNLIKELCDICRIE
mmetsp:Transcript_10456/g.25597  ORF Transcript_10456/g.25597 Transcript_10456/m.25597 type:complete len:453 (-) Transcript_10456:71-1429(-)|eukprot:CAMPEP_0178987326 /NCGR_PEP_ID=MMETSP0795-20121207/3203_1 /TAXON_ID=88552 /ORGANISM="Amoebophrya sp., Strain Ameob2" /LENGTH=452 /DNA_ID=CAMNT_0020678497 /DNA_START=89 /DNA_END=1447 /DNA_ORIENTATION=-